MFESLTGITTFVQVAEVGSFAEASRILGISASAVGKTISRLEEHFVVRLFRRSTRSLTLTAEGSLFLARCRRILDEISAAESELSNATGLPRGKLRVSAPQLNDFIMPAVASFLSAYPEVDLDVDLSDRMVDIVEEGFDVVIRTGTQNDSRLLSRRLGKSGRAIVGSPDYFQRRGVPKHPGDLAVHTCLLHKFPATGRLENWSLIGEDIPTELALAENSVFSAIESIAFLARHGSGLGYLPLFMVQQDLAAGRLQSVLEDFVDDPVTFWVVWPATKHPSPKLRAFIDHLSEHLLSDPD